LSHAVEGLDKARSDVSRLDAQEALRELTFRAVQSGTRQLL
jgi:hypothetical protein